MTTLYIKTHNKTGLKYFGKTIKDDAHKYKGSGLYWLRHIKKHGYDVSTEILLQSNDIYHLSKIALQFSEDNNIVLSENWANLREEDGIGAGGKLSNNTKNKIRDSKLGSKHSKETILKMKEIHKTKNLSETERINKSKSAKNRKHSKETKDKMSKSRKLLLKNNSTHFKIYDNNDNLKYTCSSNFKKFCEELNLPFIQLKRSYSNNGCSIFKSETSTNQLKNKEMLIYKGWYAIKY